MTENLNFRTNFFLKCSGNNQEEEGGNKGATMGHNVDDNKSFSTVLFAVSCLHSPTPLWSYFNQTWLAKTTKTTAALLPLSMQLVVAS